MPNQDNPITPNDEEDICVTLDMDDGTQVECEILTIFEVDGRDYIVLYPLTENGHENNDGTVYIYRYLEDEDGNPSLENIQNDDEFKVVEEKFDELLDEAEYEED